MDRKISLICIFYFTFGLLFAFYFAWYYHWAFIGYLSPRFYEVVVTWPYQAIGFVKDILYFGPTGKPI